MRDTFFTSLQGNVIVDHKLQHIIQYEYDSFVDSQIWLPEGLLQLGQTVTLLTEIVTNCKKGKCEQYCAVH